MDVSQDDKRKLIKDLENVASQVLALKKESIPRRPLVIEFCGSPKSGKSSCINSLELFLRRNGFRTRLLTERASICPVKNKFDPLFNVWTVSSALAELAEILSNHPKDYDIVIMDRGVFDGVCWFNFLKEKEHLDEDNLDSLVSFLVMNRLKAVIDLIYIFSASPKVSLEREYANLLTEKTGSIMKPKVLDEFRESIINTAEKYKEVYQRIEFFDTSDKPLNKVSYEVTKNILNILRENIEEKIGYFELSLINSSLEGKFYFSESGLKEINLNYSRRDIVETNNLYVQPIPILVIKDLDGERGLVVRKNKSSTSSSSPEMGKNLLYLGGHIREEDMYHSKEKDLLSIAKYALAREVKEEIGLDYHAPKFDLNPLCIWIKDNERSSKHLAICFVLNTDLESLKVSLDPNEFVVSGGSKSGKVLEVVDLVKDDLMIEPWSRIILEEIFGISAIKQQISIFDL